MSAARPYYREVGDEVEAFRAAHSRGLPLLLKGPTGCGKSRFVEAMAAALDRPLITVACNDETSAPDLIGRWLIQGGDTVWQDGPVTRAVRTGAILYLDEVAEARDDVIVVLHPLADHRRELFIDRRDETVRAAPGFHLIASYNPGYRRGLKDLKASTRQRFIALEFTYPGEAVEAEIVAAEAGIELGLARKLVALATRIRALDGVGLIETVSTRLLIHAGALIAAGVSPRRAAKVALAGPLTDDVEAGRGLRDLIDLSL
ncbi:MAG: CbbQ/NirQ/NorQ/GpvN family protein [Kofleriaceae bacterium]|jgi:nitric oxide reductase NorQ protein|nr:CbbQ/NirQ/NorQ/GpvN family protein [Kofleriaceae bacterium]MBP6835941.1 CbbQ/NirQ/NorQ/GpvN family protein [Kofleriaceae bacterium]MBP9203036.1 CbbQ/NirQ/NorQ/GpvN family protein [Kofleriaceae bacterium]